MKAEYSNCFNISINYDTCETVIQFDVERIFVENSSPSEEGQRVLERNEVCAVVMTTENLIRLQKLIAETLQKETAR